MLNAFASLKCSKKCLHNVQKPTYDPLAYTRMCHEISNAAIYKQ